MLLAPARSIAASLWTLPIFWSASFRNSSVLDLSAVGSERLERVAQLMLIGGAAPGGEQPPGGKARDQRADDE